METMLAPDSITLKLARANHIDLGARAANQAGHLSASQIRNIVESIGIAASSASASWG